jgi:type IV secretion system protein VirB5
MLVTLASGALAQIPTTDLVSIANNLQAQIQTMAAWSQNYQQLQSQITQAKQQYEAFTGSRGMGALMNSTALSSGLPPEWGAVLGSVQKTAAFATERARYPSYPDRPKANAYYDVIASQNATMSDLFAKTQGRIAQTQNLMTQIDSATDPAAKADLTNRLISEQNAIQGSQQLFAVVQQKQKQDLESAQAEAAKEWQCREFKKPC